MILLLISLPLYMNRLIWFISNFNSKHKHKRNIQFLMRIVCLSLALSLTGSTQSIAKTKYVMEIVTYCSHSMCSVVFLLCWVSQCLRCIRFTFAFEFPFISSYLLCQSYRISCVCVWEKHLATLWIALLTVMYRNSFTKLWEAEKVEAKLRRTNIEYRMDMPQKVDCVQHVDGSFSVMRHRYMEMEITLSYDVCALATNQLS